jgi:hypothetical protein
MHHQHSTLAVQRGIPLKRFGGEVFSRSGEEADGQPK